MRPAEEPLCDLCNLTQLKQKSVEKYRPLFVQSVQWGAGTKWPFIF